MLLIDVIDIMGNKNSKNQNANKLIESTSQLSGMEHDVHYDYDVGMKARKPIINDTKNILQNSNKAPFKIYNNAIKETPTKIFRKIDTKTIFIVSGYMRPLNRNKIKIPLDIQQLICLYFGKGNKKIKRYGVIKESQYLNKSYTAYTGYDRSIEF